MLGLHEGLHTMKINEIFYSIQGEGLYAGHAAVFIRMQGCHKSCLFCDTRYARVPGGGSEMSLYAVVDLASKLHGRGLDEEYPHPRGLPGIVITGGEPLLQVQSLIDLVSCLGPPTSAYSFIVVETSGSPRNCYARLQRNLLQFMRSTVEVVVSPKTLGDLQEALKIKPEPAAIKLVCTGDWESLEFLSAVNAEVCDRKIHSRLFIQPRWPFTHEEACHVVEFVERHPAWELSVQMHKTLGVR